MAESMKSIWLRAVANDKPSAYPDGYRVTVLDSSLHNEADREFNRNLKKKTRRKKR